MYISGPFVGVAGERGADWPVGVTVVEQLFMVVGSQIANDLSREIFYKLFLSEKKRKGEGGEVEI